MYNYSGVPVPDVRGDEDGEGVHSLHPTHGDVLIHPYQVSTDLLNDKGKMSSWRIFLSYARLFAFSYHTSDKSAWSVVSQQWAEVNCGDMFLSN